jgi:uncharacterized membrane protein YbaN (DUF454 family)
MLDGEVIVAIVGVFVTVFVAVPGIVVATWRWQRKQSWLQSQQAARLNGTRL